MVKFTLQSAMVAQVEVYLYSFFNLGDRWACVVNPTPWLLYFRERPVDPSAGLDGLVKLWFVHRIV
jgi:hypothetical protein